MREISDIGMVSPIIQLPVAPAFPLTAIAAMLTVLTSWLSRSINRARVLDGKLENASTAIVADLHAELVILSQRSKLIYQAVTFCTTNCSISMRSYRYPFSRELLPVRFRNSYRDAFYHGHAASSYIISCLSTGIFIATANLRIGPH